MDHTKEPWKVVENFGLMQIRSATDPQYHIGDVDISNGPGFRLNDARRIVACVNACAGINTSQLETVSPFDLAVQYKKEADSLRSAIAEKTAQVEALKKERDAYKEQRYESNKDNARYLAKILKLREAAQGVLDDDDRSVSLKDQQSRWIYRMDKLREALAATAPAPETFARFETRSPHMTDVDDYDETRKEDPDA